MRCSTLCRCMWLDLIKNVSQMHDRTPYVKRLTKICKSPLLFVMYQKYRTLTGKKRSALEMYFGM